MTQLNLTANGKAQERILAYLRENASEVLAEKINHGVPIRKDGKTLISRKALDGFMKYATDEARKLAEKGASSACVEDETVYGWAIHYFEENGIEGTLYYEDGSEYKPVKKAAPMPAKTAPQTPANFPEKQNAQMSFFGMMAENPPTMSEAEDEETDKDEEPEEDESVGDEELNDEEICEGEPEVCEPADEPEPQGSPLYQSYKKFAAKYSDALLFLRVGDFYEALGEHARKIADELDLTLTGRDCGLKKRVPMCGVPYYSAEIYFSKLMERGYKVAVAEDLTGFHFMNAPTRRIDEETGEIIDNGSAGNPFPPSTFHKETMLALYELMDGKMNLQ